MKKQTKKAPTGIPVLCHSAKKRLSFEEALKRTQHKHAAIIRALENN